MVDIMYMYMKRWLEIFFSYFKIKMESVHLHYIIVTYLMSILHFYDLNMIINLI
jgi:hypothetical protein